MLRRLRQVLFRFRVIFGALRAGLFGLALVCAAWIFLAPPTPTETARLALDPASSAAHKALQAHRIAKLLMMVGSDRIYDLVAEKSGTGLSADEVRLGIILAADGASLRPAEAAAQDAGDQPPQHRDISAKFLPARTR